MKECRILCLDPGLGVSGYAAIDIRSDQILSIHRFGEILPNRVAESAAKRDEVNIYGKRIIALTTLQDKVRDLMLEFVPDYIACEAAFYNPKRPNAYVALVQWINTVELLLYREFNKTIYMVPTRSAKQCIFNNGNATKINIQEAILSTQEITFKQKQQINSLSEHSSDAIAVGFFFWKQIYPSLVSQISLKL
jgi:Holliday junction resolvasome RuvABC endonuclease subunit